MIKIGYQGMEGSNSEEASLIMIEKLNLNNIELIPLISSKNVISALETGSIDFGVVAIKNSIGGTVEETAEAIINKKIEQIIELKIPIHHCLFKKNDNIDNKEISLIISHIQALKQTSNNIEQLYPDINKEAIEDTAIGAKRLYEDIYNNNTAIICRKNAGEKYGLSLIKENIEDRDDNATTFKMFKIQKV